MQWVKLAKQNRNAPSIIKNHACEFEGVDYKSGNYFEIINAKKTKLLSPGGS